MNLEVAFWLSIYALSMRKDPKLIFVGYGCPKKDDASLSHLIFATKIVLTLLTFWILQNVRISETFWISKTFWTRFSLLWIASDPNVWFQGHAFGILGGCQDRCWNYNLPTLTSANPASLFADKYAWWNRSVTFDLFQESDPLGRGWLACRIFESWMTCRCLWQRKYETYE